MILILYSHEFELLKMNELSNHILTHIFNNFTKFYRPWLRLVCKKWSTLITERICHITHIIKHSKDVSVRLWFEFENYVPLKSSRYLQILCSKPPGPTKCQQLQLALNMNLPLPTIINPDFIADYETLIFLITHGVGIDIYNLKYNPPPNGSSLICNDVALINWYYEQGVKFYLAKKSKISMPDIEKLNLDQTSKFYLYVRNGYFPSFLMPDNINTNKLFSCAIISQSLDLVKYVLFNYPNIKIRTYHYTLAKNNKPLLNFLYNCPRQNSLNPTSSQIFK